MLQLKFTSHDILHYFIFFQYFFSIYVVNTYLFSIFSVAFADMYLFQYFFNIFSPVEKSGIVSCGIPNC